VTVRAHKFTDDAAQDLYLCHKGQPLRPFRMEYKAEKVEYLPYERLTITGVKGLTQAQKATLRALGAIEELALPL
jgi:hypothetical protein